MVRIRHYSPDTKYTKPDAGVASGIYNSTRRKNMRHGIIASAKEVCNATRRLGDKSRLILRQTVRGSTRAVRAIRNTRVFQTETTVVADVDCIWGKICPLLNYNFFVFHGNATNTFKPEKAGNYRLSRVYYKYRKG